MSGMIFEVKTPILKRITDCNMEVIEKLKRREIRSSDARMVTKACDKAMKAFGRKDILVAEEHVIFAERHLASVDIDHEDGRAA